MDENAATFFILFTVVLCIFVCFVALCVMLLMEDIRRRKENTIEQVP